MRWRCSRRTGSWRRPTVESSSSGGDGCSSTTSSPASPVMTDDPDPTLTPRRERLLVRVVEEHIASGVPVGSKALAAEGDFGVSPSMIRYELAWLEKAGLLGHPHTSAGRVPTETGYRLYAERLVVDRAPGRAFPLVLEASQ